MRRAIPCVVLRLAALLAALCFGLPALAQSPPPPSESAAGNAASTSWSRAQQALDAAKADVRRDGLRALAPHVPVLEKALADADGDFPRAISGGEVYVLADGAAEAVAALGASAKSDGGNPKVEAVPNPYPVISFYLGSYYNEIGRSDAALRVLDRGMKLSAMPDSHLGATLPYLISERGAALDALKRFDDAVDAFDDGLKIEGLKDEDRARMLRGRGFALIALNRLDEAEEAYKDSLKLDPGNSIALSQLQYIATLRAGGQAAPGTLALPGQ